MKQLIGDAWGDFERKMLDPLSASQLQRSEMRRAFYAGAAAVFYGISAQLAPGGGEPTEAELAIADDLHAEIQLWADRLARGEV